MAIPNPISKWIAEYVNAQGGLGDGVVEDVVSTYDDLPLEDRSDRPIYYVEQEQDYVAPTQLTDVIWVSLSDYTVVA